MDLNDSLIGEAEAQEQSGTETTLWHYVKRELCRKLIHTMPDRIKTCCKARGQIDY